MREYRYKAFISYSHADEAAAATLHRVLERYRVPGSVVAARGLSSNRLYPIFRDREEFSSGPSLSDAIETALEASEYLIVVCSESSARSAWVNAEIRRFVELDRASRILCLVIGAELSRDIVELFPPALQELSEPLAADLRPGRDARAEGYLKIKAGLLGVGLDELRQRERTYRRRRLTVQAGTVAAVLAVAITGSYVLFAPPACPDPRALLAGVWGDSERTRVAAAFNSQGLSYGAETFERVAAGIDAYVADWSAALEDSCRTTYQEAAQSEILNDLRMQCLDQRRVQLGAHTRLLMEADPTTILNAVDALSTLGNLDRCADLQALTAAYPPPENPEERDAVAAVRSELATVAALIAAGRYGEALTAAELARANVASIDHPPLLAELTLLLAEAQWRAGQLDGSVDSYYNSANRAAEARDDERVARSWLNLIYVQSDYLSNLAAAQELLPAAETAVRRLGSSHPLWIDLHAQRSRLIWHTGDVRGALPDIERAVELARASESSQLSTRLLNFSNLLKDVNELERARAIAEEVLAVEEDRLGPHHPKVAVALRLLAGLDEKLGRFSSSEPLHRRAIEIREAALGPDHYDTGIAYMGLSYTLNHLGKLEEAETMALRALEIQETAGGNEFAIALNLYHLGNIALSMSRRDEARARFQRSADILDANDDARVSLPLSGLSNLALKDARFGDAIKHCTRMLELNRAAFGEKHPFVALDLMCLGQAELGLGNVDPALAQLAAAVDLLGPGSLADSDRGEVVFHLARAQHAAGNLDEARATYRQALELVRSGESINAQAMLEELQSWSHEKLGEPI